MIQFDIRIVCLTGMLITISLLSNNNMIPGKLKMGVGKAIIQFTEPFDGGNQPSNLQYIMNKNLQQNPWSTIEMA